MADDAINLWDFCSSILPSLTQTLRQPPQDLIHDGIESQNFEWASHHLTITSTDNIQDRQTDNVKHEITNDSKSGVEKEANDTLGDTLGVSEDIIEQIMNSVACGEKSRVDDIVSPVNVPPQHVVMENGLIARLPLMSQTKLDCPREGGCSLNQVMSLPGGSLCKGKDAIGSKHTFKCACGLRWQENNWRERERLKMLGYKDIRCVTFSKQDISRRNKPAKDINKKRIQMCSKCGLPRKGHICNV